jgi:SAM-dependent methyltransferase
VPSRAIDTSALVSGLQPLLVMLRDDLLKRAKSPAVRASMQAAHRKEKAARRTGDTFDIWCRGRVTQVAAAWVLSVVFVRTLEDRGLLKRRRIAGPGAEDSEVQFRSLAPFLTLRDYLLMVFKELSRLPGAAGIFDARHNPVWVLGPSSEAAGEVIAFFRQTDETGAGAGALRFSFEGEDTRFLGDLYQRLDEGVRKRFALLQTPDFIESFILEQTLDPAIRTFGLGEVRIIDPTCGSGHFLLGAFRRLLAGWRDEEPATDRQVLAQRALGQVYGVDINPYAVAIARFRLTLAFLEAAGLERLDLAPPLPLNLCVADSLLHGVTGEELRLSGVGEVGARKVWGDDLFALEDEEEALRILTGRYHAVVGNPPFKTEKDRVKREQYRDLYNAAAGKFALAAPFTERFFGLAAKRGFVGMINANSFTKREFGQALIQHVLPNLDVASVIDTSGTYIPGHGTPTLLLFGINQTPGDTPVVAVLGKRGEREEPPEPGNAPVWNEIQTHHDEIGFDGIHVSVEEIPREEMKEHPWVLAGGGARTLKKELDAQAASALHQLTVDLGYASFPGMNDAFIMPRHAARNAGIPDAYIRQFIAGESVRDWDFSSTENAIAPYDQVHELVEKEHLLQGGRHFWTLKTSVLSTTDFGGKTRGDIGDSYWGWYRWQPTRYEAAQRLVFPYVSTHNHFSIDRGGKVFNQHAPIIKLRDDLTEQDYQTLLGYLNSSTVGLWCRLVMYPKGGDQIGEGGRLSKTPWEDRLEYAGNLLQQLPVPDLKKAEAQLLDLVKHAESTVEQMQAHSPDRALRQVLEDSQLTSDALRKQQADTIAELQRLRGIMVSLQEEMDWRVYGLFKLPTIVADSVEQILVPIDPNWRPMEVRLARDLNADISARIWFDRHKREPLEDVAGPLADLYRRRLNLIDQEKYLQLLETPETKRRWPPPNLEAEFTEAYRTWLLDRIEDVLSSNSTEQVSAVTARDLAHGLQSDPRVTAVSEVYTGESSPDLERLFATLIGGEAVPFAAALRYTEPGMEKRAAWEQTWDLQRREDAGEKVDVPVPPKYATKDFRNQTFWRHRGKLDVPKERFISYLGTEPEGDPSPLVGWAGWDHLQQAQALVGLYQKRKTSDGWQGEQLKPLLAGLMELVPWVEQWHNEPDPKYGGRKIGEMLRGFLNEETHHWGFTEDDLRAWRPLKARGGRGAKNTGGKRRRPKLSSEILLEAVRRLQEGDDGVEQRALAEDLGVGSSTVGKLVRKLVSEDLLVEVSRRPRRIRCLGI